MNKSKLDRPHVKMMIAYSLAAGSSQRKIAEMLGASQPTISRIARRADILEMIQDEENRLCRQAIQILEKIHNDPVFLKEFEKRLTKELFNFKWIFRD